MLDSDQEPSYNLSKNLLLLPRILKLMKDMVNDSTPLLTIQLVSNELQTRHVHSLQQWIHGYNIGL